MPQSGAVDSATFRRACSKYATGIAVVTVRDAEGAPQGITVNSFTSVSLDPPLILVCLELKASVLPHFRVTPYFAVNVLDETQRALSTRFAETRPDRFDGVAWTPSEHGAPLLEGVLCTMECRVRDMVPAGDHVILIGGVTRATWCDGRPLIYFNSGYQALLS
jgi:flavin-dependent trigonelline monooxygenase, reductase component